VCVCVTSTFEPLTGLHTRHATEWHRKENF